MRRYAGPLLVPALVTAALLYLLLNFTLGAPVPARKAPRRAAAAPKAAAASTVVGVWDMKWGEGSYRTVFEAYGAYSCIYMDHLWVGRWKQEGSKLKVWEWMVGSQPWDPERDEPLWTVELDASGMKGKVNNSDHFPFELRTLKPDA